MLLPEDPHGASTHFYSWLQRRSTGSQEGVGGHGKGAPAQAWPDPHAALRGSLPATCKDQLLVGTGAQAPDGKTPETSGLWLLSPMRYQGCGHSSGVRALRPQSPAGNLHPSEEVVLGTASQGS